MGEGGDFIQCEVIQALPEEKGNQKLGQHRSLSISQIVFDGRDLPSARVDGRVFTAPQWHRWVQIYEEALLAITFTFGVMKANYNLKAVDHGWNHALIHIHAYSSMISPIHRPEFCAIPSITEQSSVLYNTIFDVLSFFSGKKTFAHGTM